MGKSTLEEFVLDSMNEQKEFKHDNATNAFHVFSTLYSQVVLHQLADFVSSTESNGYCSLFPQIPINSEEDELHLFKVTSINNNIYYAIFFDSLSFDILPELLFYKMI